MFILVLAIEYQYEKVSFHKNSKNKARVVEESIATHSEQSLYCS